MSKRICDDYERCARRLLRKRVVKSGIFEIGKFIEKLHEVSDKVAKSFRESGRERFVDKEEAEEQNTISQDEIDELLGGTSAENSQN